MKTDLHWHPAPFLLLCWILLSLPGPAAAQGSSYTNYLNPFDTPASTASWIELTGLPGATLTWDSTVDAANHPTSGSLKAFCPFTGAPNEQALWLGTLANRYPWDTSILVDGTLYTNISFDFRVAPGTPPTTNGSLGALQVGLFAANYQFIPIGSVALPSSATNWTHYTVPLPSNLVNYTNITGLYFSLWSDGAFTNSATCHLDNLLLEHIPWCDCPLPPALLSLRRPVPGLQLIATSDGGTAQRQSLRPTQATWSWVDAPRPVSYSFTLSDYPPDLFTGNFQVHLFLVPLADLPAGQEPPAVDWYATNVLFLQLTENTKSHLTARLTHKLDQGSGDAMFWNTDPLRGPVGTLAMLDSATPLGTWTLTFANNTNVTLTAPDGAATNCSLPAGVAARFANPLRAYFGIMPIAGYNDNVGRQAVLSRISIQGTAPELDETFPNLTLDTNRWQVVAADPKGVLPAPQAAGWLSWPALFQNWNLETTPALAPDSWTNLGPSTNAMRLGGMVRILVPTPADSTQPHFWRLHKP